MILHIAFLILGEKKRTQEKIIKRRKIKTILAKNTVQNLLFGK